MTARRAIGSKTLSGLLFATALALVATAGGTRAAPGDDQYVIIVSHDPQQFLKALRGGQDFVKGGRGRKFRIILAAAGAIVAIPGTSTVQRDYMKYRASGLEIIACRETIDALSKANRRRVPVIPGVSIQKCEGLRNRMNVAGWQTAPGI